jgi:hypothetical protein
MELTIGSLSIFIEPSGSSRLSDLAKPNPSASKPDTEEMLESSEGSSSEVNSPVSLEKAPIAEGGKARENFDSEERACQMHSNAKDFAMGSSGVSKVHQLCVIIAKAEEENNNEGNKEVDRQANKIKEHNKKEKEKVHVSAGKWRMIKVSYQSWYRGTRRIEKRSSNGISVCIIPTQEKTKGGKRHGFSRQQQYVKGGIRGRL